MLEDMSKDALFYNYYTQWIEVYKKDAIREATMAKYRMTQKWVEKLAPELKVCELTRTAYQKILNDYAKEHERQTTLDFHHQLKGAVMDAVDEGLIERDPTRKAIIKGKTPREKKIKYLNQFELHTLIADLDIKEEPNWDWFILLVAKTGMRFSEALAITPKDFDFGRQTLSISKTWDYKGKGGFLPTKNKSSVRKIQIDWQIVVKFSELVKGLPEDEPIFVGEEKIYNSTVNDALTRHCKACGISEISIHGLRHTHASLLLFAGVSNLNKRLSRKDPKYKSRNEQLDLVIVVDRLLTGFDAPCMSTIFIDRQPMGPHDLIQAFSRTNRIFDKKSKPYGQIVTFQAPVLFKKCVDDAVKLYSAGSTEDTPLIAEWDDVEPAFKKALAALRIAAQTPDDIPSMSDEEKLHFMKMFQSFDRLFAQLKSFSRYDESMLDDYGITEQEYIDYAGHYLNIKSEIGPDPGPDPVNPPVEPEIDSDYELMAYSNTRIDYEYIINLIQNIVNPEEDGDITPEEKQKKIDEAKQYVEDLRKDNPKVADIMSHLINEIELDESRFKGKSILNIVENMKHECIEQVVSNFCLLWHADKDDVMYAATHYRNGVIPNESAIKASIDYPEYKNTVEHALPKFKYYAKFFAELRSTLDDEIKPLV